MLSDGTLSEFPSHHTVAPGMDGRVGVGLQSGLCRSHWVSDPNFDCVMGSSDDVDPARDENH